MTPYKTALRTPSGKLDSILEIEELIVTGVILLLLKLILLKF
ncbi:MAG: hypothetical protein QXJ70_02250 [Acidilobaceae archaeon]